MVGIIVELSIYIKYQSNFLAKYLALNVLPVPGGPYNKTPLGGSIPNYSNFSGFNSGNSTTFFFII